MGSSENRDKAPRGFIKPEGGVDGSCWSGEHGEQVGSDAPDSSINLGKNWLIEFSGHNSESIELLQIHWVVLELVIVGATGKSLAPILDPDVFNGVVMMVTIQESKQLVRAFFSNVLVY